MFRQDSWIEKRPGSIRRGGTTSRFKAGTKGPDKWAARYTDPITGKTLSGPPFLRKSEAQAWLRDKLHEIDHGEFISPDHKDGTVDQWAEVWWRERAQAKAENTKGPWHQKWKCYITPSKLGPEKLADISRGDVEAYITYLKVDRGLAPKTIREILGILIGIFDTAIESRQPPRRDNPARQHRLGKTQQVRRQREGLMLNLMQACLFVSRINEWYRTAVWVALFMGVRPSELWGVHINDVLWDEAVVQIEQTYYPVRAYDDQPRKMVQGTVKADSNRDVPIPPWLRDDLEAMIQARFPGVPPKVWRKSADFLFLNKDGRPVNRDTFQSKHIAPAIQRTLELAEELGMRFPKTFKHAYHMRHSSVSILLAAGENPNDVAERHGHDPMTMFRVYAHSQQDAQRDMTDRLDNRYREAQTALAVLMAGKEDNILPFRGRRPRPQAVPAGQVR